MANHEKSVMFQGYQYSVVEIEIDGRQYVVENQAGTYHSGDKCVDQDGQVYDLLFYCSRCSDGRSEDCNHILHGIGRGLQIIVLKFNDDGDLEVDRS